MKRILIIVTLLSISGQALATEDLEKAFMGAVKDMYLKVENSNELIIDAAAESDCPFTKDELTEVVSGVLIRARVKPLVDDLDLSEIEGRLFLNTEVHCVETGGNPIFTIQVIFGNYGPLPVWYPIPYEFIGMGDKDYIVLKTKALIEAAITDYIRVNFDQ